MMVQTQVARHWLVGIAIACVGINIAAARTADVQHGEALAVSCNACPTQDNFKADPRFSVPRLGKQNPMYLYNSLKAYKTGKRTSPLMQPMVQLFAPESK